MIIKGGDVMRLKSYTSIHGRQFPFYTSIPFEYESKCCRNVHFSPHDKICLNCSNMRAVV